jgi:MoxR-like ATPase
VAPTSPERARDPDDLSRELARVGYLADDRLALVAFLALELERPMLVEGPAGVGKTDLARALAQALSRTLVRLQCYEGLDEAKALYEWDYAKQMLYTQLLRDSVSAQTAGAASIAEAADRVAGADAAFFSRRFLIERPLLQALTSEQPVVMLIDEVDRADPEFEAFLLEILAERQISIPELGTVRAKHAPLFVLTSNGTRDMTDALR